MNYVALRMLMGERAKYLGLVFAIAFSTFLQTFYLFTVENLKQFGALKAIGVTNRRLVGIILLQAFTVGAIGFAIGTGMVAVFFELTLQKLSSARAHPDVAERGADWGLYPFCDHRRQPAEHPARAGS